MRNNNVSRAQMDAEEAELAELIAGYKAADPNANTLHLEQKLQKLRMRTHPDDWFIDPGSGKDTEDGRRRRRALQACWTECPMKARLLCLDRGMQPGPTMQYGIYGGYTEKQRQEIYAEIQRRKAEKEEQKADEPSEEQKAPGSTD